MVTCRNVLFVMLLLAALPVCVRASGQSGVYAVIEKVVFEPATGTPQRVQLWGAFALMERTPDSFTGYAYSKPTRGYMYFGIPKDSADADDARREWRDLASVAGKRQAVAFGYWDSYRHDSTPTVRAADVTPINPDAYLMDVGLTKLPAGSPGGIVDQLLQLVK